VLSTCTRDAPASAPNVVDSAFTKLRAVVTPELLKVAPPVIVVPALVCYCPVLAAEKSTEPVMPRATAGRRNCPVPPIPILPAMLELFVWNWWPPVPSYRTTQLVASSDDEPISVDLRCLNGPRPPHVSNRTGEPNGAAGPRPPSPLASKHLS